MVPLLIASIILSSSMPGKTVITRAATDCGTQKKDVLFLVHRSQSMNISEFAFLKQMLVDIVDTFTINSDDNVVVSIITYETVIMSLPSDKSKLKNAILNMKHGSEKPPTSASAAITTAKYTIFGHGDRPDAANVVLLIAGDRLNEIEESVSNRDDMEVDKKVEWFCLGVKNADVQQLNLFASNSTLDHVFYSDSYNILWKLVPRLAQITCDPSDRSPNTGIDGTSQDPRNSTTNLYHRQSHRISGCPVAMTTYAESSIACGVQCSSSESCMGFNMALKADILNTCQLVTCAVTYNLTASGDHDFYQRM
ncbi:vitrin-like isoform X1 [Haliotis rufescens]|uniref:vitrin-like isoform X1 n=1 Tax=Haliotis rufescens TaxID=6454 RepID=UPI00201F3649|nr:vitrin-like isoform X1 [Haliotis rufescens]